MGFISIDSSQISVGKATKKELFKRIKENLDDHEARINSLSVGAAPVEVFNLEIVNASSAQTLTGVIHHEIISPCRLVQVKIAIFEKGGITTGQLQVDIKKGTSPDLMESVLLVKPTINFSSAANFQTALGELDTEKQNLAAGDILRVDVTALPPLPLGRFRLIAYGVI